MSIYRGPVIPKVDLVGYFDAANDKSYPGSGTSWNSLVGGLTCSLPSTTVTGAGPERRITFAGSTAAGIVANTNSVIGNSQPELTQINVIRTGTTARVYVSGVKRDTAGSTLMSVVINSAASNSVIQGNVGFLASNGAGHDFLVAPANINDVEFHFIGCSVSATGKLLYVDGSVVASNSVGLTTATGNTGPYSIGGHTATPSDALNFIGSIALHALYTRAFTEADFHAFFQAVRGRYKL